jgi:large subunit ribosomal protein L3
MGLSPFFMPSGLIARKIGMSRVFLPTGEAVPVTYLEVRPNIVVRTKTQEKDGYNAVVLGVGAKKWKSRKGKENTRYAQMKEWKVDSLDGMDAGKELTVEDFPAETMVSITGVSKGKGFQGVVRRHHFAGGPRTHGSHFKREPGSVGMRQQPGRIFKDHRMAGHMGHDRVTLKNRSVVVTDTAKGVIAIKGPIPGPNGATVYLTKESSAS